MFVGSCVGATFIKGFNRGLGTFSAGTLAFLFAGLSILAGPWEKIVIVISFFITGMFLEMGLIKISFFLSAK